MDEFTSTDMNHCINSTPSRDLSDDLTESAYFIYHRNVTKIQQEEHKKLYETAQLICEEANKLLNKNPHKKKEITEHAQWTLDEEKKLSKQRIENVITLERKKLDLLLSQVKSYIDSRVRDTNQHSTFV